MKSDQNIPPNNIPSNLNISSNLSRWQCFSCQKPIDISFPVGRRDECPQCGADLHVCYNCLHYDRHAYNECRESSAERVVEKDRANYCDQFVMQERKVGVDAVVASPVGPKPTSAADLLAQAEALFKKKT